MRSERSPDPTAVALTAASLRAISSRLASNTLNSDDRCDWRVERFVRRGNQPRQREGERSTDQEAQVSQRPYDIGDTWHPPRRMAWVRKTDTRGSEGTTSAAAGQHRHTRRTEQTKSTTTTETTAAEATMINLEGGTVRQHQEGAGTGRGYQASHHEEDNCITAGLHLDRKTLSAFSLLECCDRSSCEKRTTTGRRAETRKEGRNDTRAGGGAGGGRAGVKEREKRQSAAGEGEDRIRKTGYHVRSKSVR